MIDIEKTLTYMREHAREYSQAKANRVHLEQFRKSKKSMLMHCAELAGMKTGQERETYAYSHPEYIELLDGLRVAVEQEEYLRIMLEGCRLKVELYRTQCANDRIERKAYGV